MKVDVRTIRIDDDFFQVGGSSIIAGQLAGGVRRKLGSALTGADIFRYRSIAQIAAKIEKENEAADRESEHQKGGGGVGGDGSYSAGASSLGSKPLGPMEWTQPFSPTAAAALLVQSIPLLIFAGRCRSTLSNPR